MVVSEKARWFSYSTLANELGSSIAEYKKDRVTEREKIYFLVVRDFLDRVIKFKKIEENQEEPGEKLRALVRLDFLYDTGILIDSWIASDVSFPKNDEEYLTKLIKYRNCMGEIYNTQKSSDEKTISDIEKIFSKMGDICLSRVHHSSLHDLPRD